MDRAAATENWPFPETHNVAMEGDV